MPVFFIVVGVVTVALLIAAAIGTLDARPAPDPVRPFGHVPLPEGAFTARDLGDVRFDAVIRGYKMSEVDGVLDRVQRRQAELEEQVRALGGDPLDSVREVPVAAEPVLADARPGATAVGEDTPSDPHVTP